MDNKLAENTIQNMLENPLEILARGEVVLALKKHWTANHENLTNPEKFVEDFFVYLGEERQAGVLDRREINKAYGKKLKEYRKTGLRLEKPKDMFLEIMENKLGGVETLVDFGCGKLAFLKELAENNKSIKKLIGVDPKSQPVVEGQDERIEFQRSLAGIAKESVDLVVIKLVLHHLQDEGEIVEIFESIKNVLRPEGELLIFEESFPQSIPPVAEVKKYLARFNLELSEATVDFLHLSPEDKKSFLFLNDWLMNVQNSYMPWTGLYKSMEEWKQVGESAGFQETESHFIGAIQHRKRKQGMTAYLGWKK